MALIALVAVTSGVMAHEDRETGEIEMIVGFLKEPAYEGIPNAVSVRIERSDHSVQGVAGLKVEVAHLATGAKKTLPLSEVFGDPGHYTADLIPTAPGTYSFRIFGSIEGEEVDETFTGGPDTFDEVQSQKDIQFPVELPELRELDGAVRNAQDLAQDAEDSASATRMLAVAALILGALGSVTGLGAGVIFILRKS